MPVHGFDKFLPLMTTDLVILPCLFLNAEIPKHPGYEIMSVSNVRCFFTVPVMF